MQQQLRDGGTQAAEPMPLPAQQQPTHSAPAAPPRRPAGEPAAAPRPTRSLQLPPLGRSKLTADAGAGEAAAAAAADEDVQGLHDAGRDDDAGAAAAGFAADEPDKHAGADADADACRGGVGAPAAAGAAGVGGTPGELQGSCFCPPRAALRPVCHARAAPAPVAGCMACLSALAASPALCCLYLLPAAAPAHHPAPRRRRLPASARQ